jgi:hypothetical protein
MHWVNYEGYDALFRVPLNPISMGLLVPLRGNTQPSGGNVKADYWT